MEVKGSIIFEYVQKEREGREKWNEIERETGPANGSERESEKVKWQGMAHGALDVTDRRVSV